MSVARPRASRSALRLRLTLRSVACNDKALQGSGSNDGGRRPGAHPLTPGAGSPRSWPESAIKTITLGDYVAALDAHGPVRSPPLPDRPSAGRSSSAALDQRSSCWLDEAVREGLRQGPPHAAGRSAIRSSGTAIDGAGARGRVPSAEHHPRGRSPGVLRGAQGSAPRARSAGASRSSSSPTTTRARTAVLEAARKSTTVHGVGRARPRTNRSTQRRRPTCPSTSPETTGSSPLPETPRRRAPRPAPRRSPSGGLPHSRGRRRLREDDRSSPTARTHFYIVRLTQKTDAHERSPPPRPTARSGREARAGQGP